MITRLMGQDVSPRRAGYYLRLRRARRYLDQAITWLAQAQEQSVRQTAATQSLQVQALASMRHARDTIAHLLDPETLDDGCCPTTEENE